jgi:hypothetical protein
MPEPLACPGAALPGPVEFEIDPSAQEQIVAVAENGERYHVWWSAGFEVRGTEPVVRDSTGQVVAQDGEIIQNMNLHGHHVCAGSGSIYVIAEGG